MIPYGYGANDEVMSNLLEVGGWYIDGVKATEKAVVPYAFMSSLNYVAKRRHLRRQLYQLTWEELKEYVHDYLCFLSHNYGQRSFLGVFTEIGALPRDEKVINGNSGNQISWFSYLWKKKSVEGLLVDLMENPNIFAYLCQYQFSPRSMYLPEKTTNFLHEEYAKWFATAPSTTAG